LLQDIFALLDIPSAYPQAVIIDVPQKL